MERKKLLIKGEVKELTYEELEQEYKAAINDRKNRWEFLKNLNYISEEDIEQMIRVGLYRAYKNYDISKGYEFSTFAFKCMNTLCANMYRDETCLYKVPFNLASKSLDEQTNKYTENSELTLKDSIQDEYELEEDVVKSVFISQIMDFIKNRFTKDESNIVINLLTKKKTQTELANELGISQVMVSRIYRAKRNMLREIMKVGI